MSARRSVLAVTLLPLCSLALFFLFFYRSIPTSNTSVNYDNPTLNIIKEFRRKQEQNWAKIRGHTVSNSIATNAVIGNSSDSPTHDRRIDKSMALFRSVAEPSTQTEAIGKTKDKPIDAPSAKVRATATAKIATISNVNHAILFPNSKNISCYHDFHGIPISEDNVLLYNALCKVSSETDIINFRGRRTYSDMGLDFSNPHIVLHGKNPVKRWADLGAMIKEKHNERPSNKAVHVHNEIKIGDFLHYILKEHVARNNAIRGVPKIGLRKELMLLTEQEMHAAMDVGQPPMVMSNAIDENWGFLSTCIGNKTTCWINMTNHLSIHNSNYDTVRHFLSSDKVTLVLTNSHVDPVIGTHPKVIGLPLGLKARTFVMGRAMKYLSVEFKKSKLLVINNSGWGDRKRVNDMVSAAFDHTVKNSYNSQSRAGSEKMRQWVDNKTVAVETDYYSDMIQAKFVLCPSGLGMDTYRLWEIILLGSIPIVESNAGFDRSYSYLPVLVVKNFRDVTPALLNRIYPCFVKHAAMFRYEHLTLTYWREMVVKAIVNGSIDHITEAHPYHNKYCDVLKD